MKAHLLFEDQDFDFTAELPAGSEDLIQDLELGTVLGAMAGGDKFLLDISSRVLLSSLTDPQAIRYRQAILADCIAKPDIIRQMYGIAVAALEDKRRAWGFWSSQYPASILSGAVNQLDVLIVRLRELRQVADHHASEFSAEGLTALLRSLQRDLDDDYFETLTGHLKQLRFRGGELMSAQLDRDNSGINYVLRSGDSPARLEGTDRDRAAQRLLLHDPATRSCRGRGPAGHRQPGDQPGGQCGRAVGRSRHQLLHHAPG